MRFDLVFLLVDIDDNPNRDWYRTAARMMIASARRAYAGHDMRVVQLTDDASDQAEDVDVRFSVGVKCNPDELMQYRGYLLADWALKTDRPAIMCDVDLLWNTDALTGCLEPQMTSPLDPYPQWERPAPGLVFCQRPNAMQPYNGGLVMTQPGQTRFWETYRAMIKSLPIDIRGWWGDQIAFAVMLGAPDNGRTAERRFGSTIAYLPAELVSPSPKSKPTVVLENPACHFKGLKRKPWMQDYFDMLMAPKTRIAV